MKFLLAALLFAFSKCHLIETPPVDYNVNLLVNGDFSKNGLKPNQNWVITKSLEGWQTTQIEQGIGSIYNKKWGKQVVLELDGNVNNVIRQRVSLKQGEYYLRLRYAARAGYVDTSAFSVYWNGKLVTKIDGKDEQIHGLQLILDAQDGINLLEIRGEGKCDSYGMTIADVSLKRKPTCQQRSKINLVVNGDFSKNGLKPNQNWVITKSLEGWQTTQIEQGIGSIYNQKWGKQVVLELDGNVNNSIKQKFYLKAKEYNLQLKYAARAGYVKTSAFSIYWNGKQIKKIYGKDEQLYDFNADLIAQDGWNQLEIRGEGNSDSYGMTISNVSLTEQCYYNLLVNGDFSKNGLKPNQDWVITKSLEGWQTTQIEQGIGSIYNQKWGKQVVLELDGKVNSAISQKISLVAGLYQLKLKYAARVGYVKTSAFSIYWNGKLIRRIYGKNEQIYDLALPLNAKAGQNILMIRGQGKSDSYGMTIADVSLRASKYKK